MIGRIANPGCYPQVTAAAYFADPCPLPSLTQSLCKILLERSALHAWTAHPRLNPNYAPSDDTGFDIPNIAHRLLIGRGKEVSVLPEEYADWRKRDARMLRAGGEAVGKLVVLAKHHAVAQAMARAARATLEDRALGWLFGPGGDGECMLAWYERATWCRQLLDWLSSDRTVYCDYKTTAASAAPHALARRMVENGWAIQAAFAERGLATLFGPGKRRFLFVTQEVSPPYALTVAELSEAVLTMGRKQVQAALALWERCLADNRWPAYPHDIVWPEYPAWAEAAWLEREYRDSEGAAAPPAPDHIMAG